MQTELAYLRAQISILQHLHEANPSSIDTLCSPTPMSNSTISLVHNIPSRTEESSLAIPRCPEDDTSRFHEAEESDLEMLAREFLANYVPRVDE